MNVFEAIAAVTPEKPYIQSMTQEHLGVKLLPVKSGSPLFEVYIDGEKVNNSYVLKPYEYQEIYKTVE